MRHEIDTLARALMGSRPSNEKGLTRLQWELDCRAVAQALGGPEGSQLLAAVGIVRREWEVTP